jgi:hypothetical protein
VVVAHCPPPGVVVSTGWTGWTGTDVVGITTGVVVEAVGSVVVVALSDVGVAGAVVVDWGGSGDGGNVVDAAGGPPGAEQSIAVAAWPTAPTAGDDAPVDAADDRAELAELLDAELTDDVEPATRWSTFVEVARTTEPSMRSLVVRSPDSTWAVLNADAAEAAAAVAVLFESFLRARRATSTPPPTRATTTTSAAMRRGALDADPLACAFFDVRWPMISSTAVLPLVAAELHALPDRAPPRRRSARRRPRHRRARSAG